jgi:hypothetical protein
MNKFRIPYKDAYRLCGGKRPQKTGNVKTPPNYWLWYIHFSMSMSRLRYCLKAKMSSTKARRLCKEARHIDLIGCIGGSIVYWRSMENPAVFGIEDLVFKSIENGGKI